MDTRECSEEGDSQVGGAAFLRDKRQLSLDITCERKMYLVSP